MTYETIKRQKPIQKKKKEDKEKQHRNNTINTIDNNIIIKEPTTPNKEEIIAERERILDEVETETQPIDQLYLVPDTKEILDKFDFGVYGAIKTGEIEENGLRYEQRILIGLNYTPTEVKIRKDMFICDGWKIFADHDKAMEYVMCICNDDDFKLNSKRYKTRDSVINRILKLIEIHKTE